MLKIGITGNIGSGKTTVCRIFEHLGVEVYYSDARAKQFYQDSTVKQQIKNHFGESVFDAEEKVSTSKLAALVFKNAEALQTLNNLIHPLVIADFMRWCEQRKTQKIVLFESAIIYPCGLENLFDRIILVDAPLDKLLQRTAQRDNVDMEVVKQRLSFQQATPHHSYQADFIIINDEKSSLLQEVVRIYALLNI